MLEMNSHIIRVLILKKRFTFLQFFLQKKIFLYFAICIHKTTGFFFFLYAILTLRVTYEIYK